MQIMNNNENLRSDPTISTHPQPHSKRKNSIFERIMSISILKDLNGKYNIYHIINIIYIFIIVILF